MTDRGRLESGHVSILVLGLTVVVFSVVGLTVDGTRAFLMQRSLQNIADSAAISAATSIDRRAYYSSGGRLVELDELEAEATAARILGQKDLPVEIGFVSGDHEVEVVVRTDVRTSFLRLVGVDGIDVSARAIAAPFTQVAPNVP